MPNERGHYPIPPMEVELGLLEGTYQNQSMLWLRWWDLQGNLLLTGQEAAQQERKNWQKLVEQLKSLSPEQLQPLGIDPKDLE